MDDLDLDIGDLPPPDESMPEETPRRNRKPVGRAERRMLDSDLAARLEGLGLDPWLPQISTFTLIDIGETFDQLPVREHWIFANTAKSKAADFVKHFAAFVQQADTSRFRSYVLRPTSGKGRRGELTKTLKALSATFGNVMTAAVADKIGKPIVTILHPRFDTDMQLWDVHLHVVIDVHPEQSERMFDRICRNFSTPWTIELEGPVGAWVNYSSSWIVDHRNVVHWPTWAIEEFWGIRGMQLQRKVGAFATFCRGLKGKNLNWIDSRVVITDKVAKPPRKAVEGGRRDPAQKAFVTVKINGQAQRCIITKRPRMLGTDGQGGYESGAPRESTTITGPIPTTPIGKTPDRRTSRRLRTRITLWMDLWPYGRPGRPPRPIARRLAKKGLITGSMPPARPWRRQGPT